MKRDTLGPRRQMYSHAYANATSYRLRKDDSAKEGMTRENEKKLEGIVGMKWFQWFKRYIQERAN